MGSTAIRSASTVSLFEDDNAKAERLLLGLADYVYGHTALKPMSKTLFVISRCLLVADELPRLASPSAVVDAYDRLRQRLGEAAPEDDFFLGAVLLECADHLDRIISTVVEVRQLTRGTDCLGLAFNALLRGKIESGEGLGTYLTPEEVVGPMVQMVLASVDTAELDGLLAEGALFGDICGGTGRFVFALSQELRKLGVSKRHVERGARLYDQSRLAVDLARINFVLQDERPRFSVVADSLIDSEVRKEGGRYALLATNPPFGAGKYRFTAEGLDWLPGVIVQTIVASGRGGAVDPAILFLLRNLDLLRLGGALTIVLPDGIARGAVLADLLRQYERARGCGIDLAATVSLPAVTFSLGGTVAKTSFLVLRKLPAGRIAPTFVAAARHVGFLKKGNRRAADPHGNDLIRIAAEYTTHAWEVDALVRDWRSTNRPSPRQADPTGPADARAALVSECGEAIRTKARPAPSDMRGFHVSVLDVDATGLIDVIAAHRNDPISRGLACRPGDVLLSCINPRHWRVAVVPEMQGDWSCSPEFLVLRPRLSGPLAEWKLALRLHHRNVIDTARGAASGTSSSRQRVEKDALLYVELPQVGVDLAALDEHRRMRLAFYEQRLREGDAYARLHAGEERFDL